MHGTTPPTGLPHASQVDESIDTLYAFWPGAQPQPQPLPEAAFSLTLKGTVGGQDALLTVRGMTPAEFQRNVEAIAGLLDAPPAASAPGNAAVTCPIHGVPMKLNHGKDGSTWHSHRLSDGAWCKGRQ